MFDWINKQIVRFFKKQTKFLINSENSNIKAKNDNQAYFKEIVKKSNTPSNDSIADREFVIVIYKKRPLWVLFKCPCGCQYVITLPLQKTNNVRWTFYESEMGRPTLFPSVWQNKGCYSHFWIKDGRVIWCKNRGFESAFQRTHINSKELN